MARPFARSFYKSREWQRQREYILKRDRYLCQVCGNPAEEIHHKIHLNPDNINDPIISLHESNLVSLCTDCHFKEHAKGRKKEVIQGYEFDSNGYMVPVKPPHSD